MRRFAIGLAILLALSLMLAAVAVATPSFCDPANPRYDLDNKLCTTTTTSDSTTITTTPPPTLEACPTGAFNIDIPAPIKPPGEVNYECLWTPEEPLSTSERVVGKVTVIPGDGISRLLVFVRDSSPGDICLLAQNAENQTGPDGSFVGSFDLSYSDLPDDGVWDPEDLYPDYADYEGETYWSFDHFDIEGENGTNWCYPQDGVDGMREDLNGEPLHLWVRFYAKKTATPVTVTLTPGQAGS